MSAFGPTPLLCGRPLCMAPKAARGRGLCHLPRADEEPRGGAQPHRTGRGDRGSGMTDESSRVLTQAENQLDFEVGSGVCVVFHRFGVLAAVLYITGLDENFCPVLGNWSGGAQHTVSSHVPQ